MTQNKSINLIPNNKEMLRNAHYYIRVPKSFTQKDINEENMAEVHHALVPVKLSQKDYLLVNTELKGKPGDIVMWVDDDGDDYLDKITKSIRPSHVIGKVESVITKL